VEQADAPAVVALVQPPDPLQLGGDVAPAPLPRPGRHPRRVDHALVLEPPGVGLAEAFDAVVVTDRQVVRLRHRCLAVGVGFDDVGTEELEQRRVAEHDAHRRLRTGRGVPVRGERRDAVHVPDADVAPATVHLDRARAADLQGERGGAAPRRPCRLTGGEDLDRHLDARRQAAAAGGAGMHEQHPAQVVVDPGPVEQRVDRALELGSAQGNGIPAVHAGESGPRRAGGNEGRGREIVHAGHRR
jgi:hypothetical protein